MNNSNSANHTNGSSVHSSRSTTPELVGDLPTQANLFEQPDERVPTPFPLAQQPIDEPNPIQYPLSLSSSWVYPTAPLPLAMPIPSSRSRSPVQQAADNMQPSTSGSSSISIPPSPIQHAPVNMQPSTSGSSSISIPPSPIQHAPVNMQPSTSGSSSISIPPSPSNPPVPLTPTVVVITNYPHPLSTSVSQLSLDTYAELVERLYIDRRMNEDVRSRSVASGLYQFASMVVPILPEYDSTPDDLGVEARRRRRERQEDRRYVNWGLFAGALIVAAFFGKQMGVIYIETKK